MKIWFVSHYAMPPKYEMREKTQKFAQFFKNIGHEVLLVTASTIHGSDINLISDNRAFIEAEYDGLKYLHIRCSNYTGNGLSRIVNMLEFGWRLKRNICNFDIPDVIVADVNCINYRAIADICKKYHIRFIIDIRDLWPLSIVEYLHFSEKNPIIKYLYHREKSMYIRANEIIFSIEGGWEYIIDKGWTKYIDKQKVHHINNGVDLAQFNIKKQTYRMESLGFLCDESRFNVVYTGSIRRANGLLLLLDAAKIIREIQPNIQFLLYGDGDDKPELEKYCREYKLNNVHFLGRIDKNFIPFALSMSDCNVLNYQEAATWEYGGSQNKLFEYLASGKPIISNIHIGYSLIERYSCGIVADNNNAEAYAQAILDIYNLNKEEYENMCSNAKKVAYMYDYKILANKLINIINK